MAARGRRGTVLVVDDDASLRMLCRVNLELDGYEVLEAGTLTEARSHLDSRAVDVLLLDVHVGGENGFDVIETARRSSGPAIALFTGSAHIGPDERALVDAVMSKPFELDDLSSTVHRLAAE